MYKEKMNSNLWGRRCGTSSLVWRGRRGKSHQSWWKN